MGTKLDNKEVSLPDQHEVIAPNGHGSEESPADLMAAPEHFAAADGYSNGSNGVQSGRQQPGASSEPSSENRAKIIKFSHVSKRFVLHTERSRSFQEMLTGLLGRGRLLKVPPPELAPENKDFWALRDVNFSVYAGEALGIIGENGSGKSTTLKMISKILYPTDGSVSVKGKVSALLELGTGFHPDLTGRENIYLNGSLLGFSRKDMASRYDDIVTFSELERFIDTPIKHWSSGMVMRLGFAVAISVDPDILITDEVLAVGDEAFQRKCMEQIARFRRAGKTIIFVSHALEAVRSLCSRVLWLEHGVLRADGPSSVVIDQYLEFANQRHRERLDAEYKAEHSAASPSGHTETDISAHGGDIDADAAAEGINDVPEVVIPQMKSRWGTSVATVEGVTFLDVEGKPSKVFTTNDRMTIRIFYRAPKRIEHPVFGLALYAESGQHLTGPNNRFAGYDVPFIEGEGHIDYVIASIPLLSGVYDVTVALTNADMTEMFDHQHRWYSFVMQPNPDLPERFGTIYIPGEWHKEER